MKNLIVLLSFLTSTAASAKAIYLRSGEATIDSAGNQILCGIEPAPVIPPPVSPAVRCLCVVGPAGAASMTLTLFTPNGSVKLAEGLSFAQCTQLVETHSECK